MSKYCIKCGEALNFEAKFCSNCGESVVNALNNDRVTINNKKEELLSTFDTVYNYFQPLRNKYKAYENLCFAISNTKPIGVKRYIILGFAIFGVTYVASMGLSQSFKFGNLCVLIGVVVAIYAYRNKCSKNSKDVDGLYKQLNKVGSDLYSHYVNYANCPISYEYSNPELIIVLRKMISSGRAESVKEAINLMIDDEHKARMETGQMEMLNETRRAANAAGTAAFFSAASFFLK